jgi:hypothetical protein
MDTLQSSLNLDIKTFMTFSIFPLKLANRKDQFALLIQS